MNALSDKKEREDFRKTEKRIGWAYNVSLVAAGLASLTISDSFFKVFSEGYDVILMCSVATMFGLVH